MTVSLRTTDELHHAPHMATLPVLSACIGAFSAALEIAHPSLLCPHLMSPRETAALLLRMYLDACQGLLREYDRLTFDEYCWSDDEQGGPDDRDEPDDDIPF